MPSIKRYNGTGWETVSSGKHFLQGGISGRLIKETVLINDSHQIEFTGLDSLVDGDYTLEAMISANSTGIPNLICLINGDTSETGYMSLSHYVSSSQNTYDVTQDSSIIGTLSANRKWSMNFTFRVVDGEVLIETMSVRSNDNTNILLFHIGIKKTASNINKIVLKDRANTIGFKSNSSFRLYGSKSVTPLVPYNPQNFTNLTSDRYLQAGEIAYIDYTNATSVSLHVQTVEGIYEISLVGTGISSGTESYGRFTPNNTTMSSLESQLWSTYSTGDGGLAEVENDSGFKFGYAMNINLKSTVYTYTRNKNIEVKWTSKYTTQTNQISLYNGRWVDTTTAWTSLGTISFSHAQSGKVIIKRIL